MPTPCCPFIKPDGAPCAARPLSGSDFCLFHDPAHQNALAQSRSKGGSTPRRRLRRYPRLLDHIHVAELLGELFIDALNDPEAIDTQRLHALIALARTLLKAVGTPPTFLVHSDRRAPSPAAGHPLRVYPPLAPEVEALLAAEPCADSSTQQPPPPAGSPVEAILTIDAGDGDAWNAAAVFLPAQQSSAPRPAPPPLAHRRLIDVNASLEELATVGMPLGYVTAADTPPVAVPPPPSQQAAEQALNRSRTGPSPIDLFSDLLLAALLPPRPAQQPTPKTHEDAPHLSAPGTVPSAPDAAADAAASPEHLDTRTPEHLNPEQDGNTSGTGLPGTHGFQPGEPCAGDPTPAPAAFAPPGDASPIAQPSRPRAGWPAHYPPPAALSSPALKGTGAAPTQSRV